jgi:hypothetical protein
MYWARSGNSTMNSGDRGDKGELLPDAWERFERAVAAVSKSGPQHKKPTPESTGGVGSANLAREGENGEVRNEKKRAQGRRKTLSKKGR